MPTVPSLGIKARARVELDWGGSLYTSSSSLTSEGFNSSNKLLKQASEKEDPLHHRIPLPQLLSTISTMTIISNEMIKLIGQIWVNYLFSFELSSCEELLTALETSYWHAFTFNQNYDLRKNLVTHGYFPSSSHQTSSSSSSSSSSVSASVPHFSKGPQSQQQNSIRKIADLLDQEVLSLECIIHMVYTLYFQDKANELLRGTLMMDEKTNDLFAFGKHSKEESADFSKRWVERISCLVFSHYLEGEITSLSDQSLQVLQDIESPVLLTSAGVGRPNQKRDASDSEGEDEDEGFGDGIVSSTFPSVTRMKQQETDVNNPFSLKKRRQEMYLSPLLMVLSNIEKFNIDKFRENQLWLVPWLNQLIICENSKIRNFLAKIYFKHVNPKFL
jgi:hypothetical protein